MRTLLTALTALMLFATPVAAGDYEDAVAVYGAGDYQKALRLFKSFAERGDARAQYSLGVMYDFGRGVPKDYAKAVHWYRKAAEQGYVFAQSNLGVMYYQGKGVLEDYVQAYAWWSIAAQENEDAKKNKGIIKGWMTPAQIAEAQKLSSEYWEKYVVPFQKD